MTEHKIKTQKKLLGIIKELKKERKKIVAYSGSFDILHAGHITAIEEAAEQGDILVMLVNSDTSVKKYKGRRRPIISEKNRIRMLAALEDVDYVTCFDEINPKEIIEKIKPDIYCNGSDWGKNCIEREVVEKNGGKVHVLKWTKGLSTSGMINKIVETYKAPVTKAVFLDRDGTININHGYVYKKEDFEFTPHAIRALQALSKTDYKIIIITNQSGIGRGYYKEKDLERLMKWLVAYLKDKNIRIDKYYYCPHHVHDGCYCRKPSIGMFLQAVEDLDISLSESWMVGDDEKDIIAGREANIKTIKLEGKMSKERKLEPSYYAQDLLQAVEYIIGCDEKK